MVNTLYAPSEGFGRSPEAVYMETRGHGSARMTGYMQDLGRQMLEGVYVGMDPIDLLSEAPAEWENQWDEAVDTALDDLDTHQPSLDNETGTISIAHGSFTRSPMRMPSDERVQRFKYGISGPRSMRRHQVGVRRQPTAGGVKETPIVQYERHRGPYRGHKPRDKK